jgi:hypothetical protein
MVLTHKLLDLIAHYLATCFHTYVAVVTITAVGSSENETFLFVCERRAVELVNRADGSELGIRTILEDVKLCKSPLLLLRS